MLDSIFEIIYQKVSRLKNSVEAVSKFGNTLWVVANDDGNDSMKMVFQENGNLMISQNGKVTSGQYQLLLVANAIIITVNGESRLYNHVYTNKGLIFLQLDDGSSKPFVLINNNLLNGMSTNQYLNDTYIKPQKAKKLHDKYELFFWKNLYLNQQQISVYKSKVSEHYFAFSKGKIIPKGVYNFTAGINIFMMVGEHGTVEKLFAPKKHSLKDGRTLTVHKTPFDARSYKGSEIFIDENPAPNGTYKLNWFKSVTVKDGIVIKN
jgi:hypothetical protein